MIGQPSYPGMVRPIKQALSGCPLEEVAVCAVAGSLNKSSCLAQTLGVTKFVKMRDMILVTLCCAA